MQEFRPASVIALDTEIAHSLRAGEVAALTELIVRYGATVTGLATQLTKDEASGRQVARDVFVEAWRTRTDLEPGQEFAPWLASMTVACAARSGPADGVRDVERAWAVASAVASIPPARHEALRRYYGDGQAIGDGEVAADQNKIERRLSHLDDADVAEALADPFVWVAPESTLADRVRESIGASPALTTPVVLSADTQPDPEAPGSRFARSLRAPMLGFVGAFAALLGGIAVLSVVSGTAEDVAIRSDLTPTGVVVEVNGGEIVVIERDSGIEIRLDAPSLPLRSSGAYYEGVLVTDDGEEVGVGTFVGGVDVTLWGGVELDRARTFRVVLGDVGVARVAGDVSAVVLKADLPRR